MAEQAGTIEGFTAKMLRNQIKASKRRNQRQMKGEGFEQMLVGNPESKNQWVFDRVKKCKHCQGRFKPGEVTLVSADMGVIIHADCIVALADAISIISQSEALLEAEKLRIQKTGEFFHAR